MAIRQLPIVGGPTNPSAALRKIALEEHFIDPTLVHPNYGDSFSSEFGQQESSYAGFNPKYADAVSARLHDLRDSRIEEMDAAGIDIAVLSHTIGGAEGISDPTVAVSTARRVNDFLAAEIAASDGRFAGFASVALQDVGAAVKELTRAVTDLGFVGVMVNGYSNLGEDRLYLDEDRFEPFWTALEELRVPLYLHPRLPARAVQDAIYRGHPELVGAT
jgi:predicted TIM-barrel fold metal-dependent hydrolase